MNFPVESVRIKLNAEGVRQFPEFSRSIQTNGENDHVELFLFDAIIKSGIPDNDILVFGIFSVN